MPGGLNRRAFGNQVRLRVPVHDYLVALDPGRNHSGVVRGALTQILIRAQALHGSHHTALQYQCSSKAVPVHDCSTKGTCEPGGVCLSMVFRWSFVSLTVGSRQADMRPSNLQLQLRYQAHSSMLQKRCDQHVGSTLTILGGRCPPWSLEADLIRQD